MSAVERIPHLTASAIARAYYRRIAEQETTGIGAAPHVEAAGELPEIGVGLLGYAFMGKAHSNAFRKLAYMTWPPPFVPRLVAIAGRNEQAVAAAAQRYGFERWTTDWQDVVADERVGLFD